MSTQSELTETLRTVADWIDRIGAEIRREVEGTLGESDSSVEGYAVRYGGSNLNVLASPDNEYISITYSFSPVGTIAMSRLQSEIEGGRESSSVSGDAIQEARQEAAVDLRDHFDTDELESIYYGLFEWIGADEYAIEVRVNGSVIHEVQISKKLFVNDDRVGLQRFADSMQAVASKGALGNNYLRQKYELDTFVETPNGVVSGSDSGEFNEDSSSEPDLN